MRLTKAFFTVTLDDDEPIVSTLKLYHGKSFMILISMKNQMVQEEFSIYSICYLTKTMTLFMLLMN